MFAGYRILFVLALLWETVYTVSYGVAAFRKGRKLGGIAVNLLALLPIALFSFLTFFQGE